MLLFDDETLKEVGRFAVQFSVLDDLISALAALVLECGEFETAQSLTAGLTTGRKLELMSDVCKSLAKRYPLMQHKELLKQLGEAKKLVDDRNTVIHGSLTIDRHECLVAQSRKGTVALTPDKLSAMVRRIERTTHGLATEYLEFMDAIHRAREAASKKRTAPLSRR